MENLGLLSADFGSVYSPDGREHAIIGTTPLQSLSLPGFFSDPNNDPTTPQQAPPTTTSPAGTPGLPGSATVEGWLNKIFGTTPANPMGLPGAISGQSITSSLFIRLGLAILALILLVVVAVRITGVRPIPV